MASEYTYVNAAANEVKNMWVHNGTAQQLVKLVYAHNSGNIVHRASYDVTYNSTTYITVSEASPRIGKHGLSLTYTLLADHENRMVSVTSTWGAGILTQIDPPSAEWTYVTPNITSDGSITITEASDYVDVTSHPSNRTIYEGQVATFSISAVGDQTLSYQWEYSPNSGTNWYNIGVNSSNLSVPTTNTSLSGRLYRCTATSGNASETSNSATLTVNAVTMYFTTEPTTIDEGQQKSWSVYAPNSTYVYWNLDYNGASSADISSATSGVSSVVSNYATIYITTNADLLTEPGTEQFRVRAYVDSGRTNLKDTSAYCTIQDTSQAASDPEPTLTTRTIDGTVVDLFGTGPTSYAGIRFLRNGQLQKRQGSSSTYSNITGEWLNDIDTTNGDDFYLYVTKTGTGSVSSDSAYSTLLQMNVADRYWQMSTTSNNVQEAILTIQVRKPSGTILRTRTITMIVQVDDGEN